MVELRKICIILGASLPPPPFKRKLVLIPKLFPPACLPPSRGAARAPRPPAILCALRGLCAGFSRHWKRVFLPLFLLLPSCRARLEAAPPEGGLSASGGAASCRAAGGASRPGEPFPLARLGGDASPHRLLPPPAFPPALIARRGRRDVEHRFADIEKRFCPFHSSPTPSTFFCTFPCCPCTFFWEPPSRFPPARLEAAPPEAARQMATVI